jgi:SagB-type dehydrogenase family enzyme
MRRTLDSGRLPPPSAVARPKPAIPLPQPHEGVAGSLQECLRRRRSTREFSAEPLQVDEIAQLLWAGQGITSLAGLRTAPSPGAVYPLRLYLAAGRVESLIPGVYRYNPDEHAILRTAKADARWALSQAAMGQQCAADCAALIVIAATYRRLSREFGTHAQRLALIETGHVGQNVCLQAAALGLGCVGLGRFDPDLARHALHLPDSEDPLYLVACGRRAMHSGR